jgi:hypothetical protein
MGADEMREIADVLAVVLHATSPGVVASGPNQGKPSLVAVPPRRHRRSNRALQGR